MDNEAIRHSLQKIGYETVRQHQKEILENVLQGKDCLLVAPTGKYQDYIFNILADPYLITHAWSCSVLADP